MHAYAEILDPSVVSHAVFVTLSHEPCLILVRGTSLLQVYSHINDPQGPKWLTEFTLDGSVTQLDSLNGSNVVVTFKTAKLVVLEWDPKALTFITRSLHLYEKLVETCNFGSGMRDKPILTIDSAKNSMMFRFQRDLAALITYSEFSNPLFPELQETSNHEFKSSPLPLIPLVPNEACSEVVDVAYMPIYTVPTIAILYWSEPSWEGLVPKYGEQTKGLAVVNLKSGAESKSFLSVSGISLDVFKIVPVHTRGSLMLLIGSSSLSYVDEAGLLVQIHLEDDDALLRFENCEAVELSHTDWIILALESGAIIAVNMSSHTLQHLKPAGFAPEPTCLAMWNHNTFLIGSRVGECLLCRADIQQETKPNIDTSKFSLKGFYEKLIGQPRKPAMLLGIDTLFSFHNIGALTAITPIDDGIACSSGDSVVIVERELPLIELDRVEPAVDLIPGRFWVLNDHKPGSKLLLVSSKTLDYSDRNGESQSETEELDLRHRSSKRRNTRQAREFTLFYDDLLLSNRDSAKPRLRKRPKQVRAFATDQATLAVHEGSEVVVVVQTRSLSAYETGSWKFLSAKPIPTAEFAEIQDGLIVTRHREGKEVRVYSCVDLEILKAIPGVEHTAICKSFLLTSSKTGVNVSSPTSSDKGKHYDLSRLDRVVSPSETVCNEGPDLIALFALEFANTNFIGVHLNRLFCVYELIGDSLLKRFTIPFMVNQSPVWLSAAQMLVFLGPQSYVLVKGRESKFACHPLQTDGLYSLDVTACSNYKGKDKKDDKSSTGKNIEKTSNDLPSFVWLDDRQRLHISRIDPDVDYVSNKLPYRRIHVESGISIQDIAYHDDTQSLVIGANRSVKYEETPAQQEDEGEPEEEEDVEMKDETDNDNGDIGQTSEDESKQKDGEQTTGPSPNTFTGCVFMLPLSSYKAFEMPEVTFERYETVISLRCVDHCDAGGKQLVAIGTAVITEEDSQCNGHIYLYRVEEPQEPDSFEEVSKKPNLHFFAKDYLRGAVSSIVETMGFLAVAHGQQIRVYNFHKELEPVGFFDTEVFMTDMKAVRNLLLLGEEFRGPRLVNFGLQPHRMDLLCSSEVVRKTHVPLTSIEGVSSAQKADLCLVSSDANGRLQILQYDPENPESAGGTQFVPLASFHTGSECLGFAAVELANEDLVAYGVTRDGVLFSVSPISEEVFRTLFVLTQQMMDKEQSVAGLNPRAHRQMLATSSNHEHHLIDFNYAQRLWNLSLDRQVMYSRKLGYNGLNRAHRALNSGGRDSLKL